MCDCVDGIVKVFKSKTSDKQPLPILNAELSPEIPSPGISSVNTCRQIRNYWPGWRQAS